MAEINTDISVAQFLMTSVPSGLIALGVYAVKRVFGDVEHKLATLSTDMAVNAKTFEKKLDDIKEAQVAQAQALALNSQKIILMDSDTIALKVVVHDLELRVEKLTAAVEQLKGGK